MRSNQAMCLQDSILAALACDMTVFLRLEHLEYQCDHNLKGYTGQTKWLGCGVLTIIYATIFAITICYVIHSQA